MLRTLLHLVINIIAVILMSYILPNFEVRNIFGAAAFVVILTLLNTILVPVIKILSFPVNLLTLGFFNLLISLGTLALALNLNTDVNIKDGGFGYFPTLILVSIILGIANSIASQALQK